MGKAFNYKIRHNYNCFLDWRKHGCCWHDACSGDYVSIKTAIKSPGKFSDFDVFTEEKPITSSIDLSTVNF